ncbi:formate dehydrogenase accessory sulfurtransferase FdhD [Beijerinckia mobilis]|uniref:formate dehydrogenase accessory sulfurtransferase FdhD n=1 Tax=Beijerinckia mobilis TaxID=231434 RepID=UPI000A7B19D0|nr:formate dehydrogenase accessory sulfurtransferase FdhD [Beijerinckia mobilis]
MPSHDSGNDSRDDITRTVDGGHIRQDDRQNSQPPVIKDPAAAPVEVMHRWPAMIIEADGAVHTQPSFAIADETPINLIYNTIPYAVMMASAQDIEDFAMGFSLTEGIIPSRESVREIIVTEKDGGIEVRLHIAGQDFQHLLQSGRRAMVGRTGCGICGAETLDALVKPRPRLPKGKTIALTALRQALVALDQQQTLNNIVHMVHGAAWATHEGEIVLVREDVGRHNALDKLIGAGLRQGIDLSAGFCLITSRCSYEMAQKAITAGMPVLVAVSAPTSRALRLAEAMDLTVVALARRHQQILFTSPERIDLTR